MPPSAQPPDLARGSCGDLLGGKGTVFVGVPFLGNLRLQPGQAGLWRGPPAGAIGATLGLGRGAAINQGLPFMALRAVPPDFLATFGRDIPRGEVIILAGMPLVCNLGVAVSQAGLCCCPPAGAIRTAAGVRRGAVANHCLIVMALGAQPPDLLATIGRDLLRSEGILAGVPLVCYLGVQGSEAILCIHSLARAIRAAGGIVRVGAVGNLGLIVMALGAQPPDLAGGSCGNILGGEGAIFIRMPLVCYLRIAGGQAIIRMHPLARTIGAALELVGVGAAGNRSLIIMALGAQPPDFLATARGDVLGGEGVILAGVPFLGNLRLQISQAGLCCCYLRQGFPLLISRRPALAAPPLAGPLWRPRQAPPGSLPSGVLPPRVGLLPRPPKSFPPNPQPASALGALGVSAPHPGPLGPLESLTLYDGDLLLFVNLAPILHQQIHR